MVSLKNIFWRIKNLSASEFLSSFFPKEVEIEPGITSPDPIAQINPEIRPFILVKPAGLSRLEDIRRIIAENSLIAEEHHIRDYESLDLKLHKGYQSESQLSLMRSLFPGYNDKGYCFILESGEDLEKLKKKIRKSLKVEFYKIKGNSEVIPLTYVHTPDNVGREFKILRDYMADLDSAGVHSLSSTRARSAAGIFKNMTDLYNLTMYGRGVVFLTSACNLNCNYCKKHDYPREDVDSDVMKRVINTWSRRNLKVIHFTGGEPTFRPELLEALVSEADKRGLISSLSTNGTGSKDLYSRLVDRGAKWFYISIDSFESEEADMMAGVKGTFEKATSAIKHLARLRDEGKDIYLTLNISLNEKNYASMIDAARFAMQLAPDDFKFIPVTGFQPEDDLDYLERTSEIVPKEKFPFFHYRLKNFYSPRGLDESCAKRCYIPLDERVFDTCHYYPCSIYLREGGEPIGNHLEDSISVENYNIVSFILNHNPLKDPICRNNCCDITREYNMDVERRIENI